MEVKEEYVYTPEDDVIFERYEQQNFEKRLRVMSDEDFDAVIELRKGKPIPAEALQQIIKDTEDE